MNALLIVAALALLAVGAWHAHIIDRRRGRNGRWWQ